jgi:hypothetical protein
MLGERLQVWLKKLKIAVIQKDMAMINHLLEDMPKLENIEDMKQAQFLIEEATSIVQKLKDDTVTSMQQMKKNIDFLKSAIGDTPAKFDITS